MGKSPRRSCPACGTPVSADQSLCSRCGTRLIIASEATTVFSNQRHSPAFPHNLHGQHFAPGAVLGRRYRIVNLLGIGGMGEVYRADDLLLGQPVALKFLPLAATASTTQLTQFRNEVRIARQVSHPNVCRVYDIGEVAGLTYLSMEYVDGGDLASLLRRIGRLPQEKALEIARMLCAGLTAAHNKGVIHCDLKPANIMLDGKGQVHITDFGLARLAEKSRDVAGGTPPYMAPEQRAGREVTARSDIYALGIVLHELFTGKRPSSENRATELDPSVERVIIRCLETDPLMRPATPLSVAAALPGGDPLALALAAGETPSAEVVADAGPVEGLRVPVAMTCLVAVVVGLITLCFLRQRFDIVNQIPMENSSEVLAANAREIAKSLGYEERPLDTSFGWDYDFDYVRYASEQNDASTRRAVLSTNRPAAIYFWYRESSNYLVVNQPFSTVTCFNPPGFEAGMLEAVLDSEGRLIEFNARPRAETRDKSVPKLDWSRLFAASGLDPEHLTAAQPVLTPSGPWDARAAWIGSWNSFSQEQLRVEANAYRGLPVFFQMLGSWTRPNHAAGVTLGNLSTGKFVFFVVVLPSWAALLAWRNARAGRGDRRGASRLASIVFLCALIASLASSHHVPTAAEFIILFSAVEAALIMGVIGWLLYLAFEPQVRKRSPVTLISWSRFLTGKLRDPLVGGDLLVVSPWVPLRCASLALF
jgi:serine/threonine protein kinase